MKFDGRIKELGPVNHAALKAAVGQLTAEDWLADTIRQKAFDVHAQTQSINLLLCEGWPEMRVEKRPGWDRFATFAMPLMGEIIKTYYSVHGATIRALCAKLVAGGVIDEHMDGHPSFAVAHRIHVPLVTNDEVDFKIDGEIFHLQEGVAYEISNLDLHAVHNRSQVDRVHFIFDYLPDAPAS